MIDSNGMLFSFSKTINSILIKNIPLSDLLHTKNQSGCLETFLTQQEQQQHGTTLYYTILTTQTVRYKICSCWFRILKPCLMFQRWHKKNAMKAQWTQARCQCQDNYLLQLNK